MIKQLIGAVVAALVIGIAAYAVIGAMGEVNEVTKAATTEQVKEAK